MSLRDQTPSRTLLKTGMTPMERLQRLAPPFSSTVRTRAPGLDVAQRHDFARLPAQDVEHAGTVVARGAICGRGS